MKQFFIAGALAASLASAAAVAQPAQDTAKAKATATAPAATAPAAAPVARTLMDRDALRSIEVVSDRRESITQFFARQKLAVASWPVLDGKPVRDAAQFAGARTRSLFVSYPLFNDDSFRMNLYGAYYELPPLAPQVLSLLRGEVSPTSGRTFLILAPGPKPTGRTGNPRQSARIVGRLQVFGAWQPDDEASSLSFVPSRPAS